MANEKRLRANSIGGLIEDNPLTLVATTLTSAGLAALAVIDTTNYVAVVLDPDGLEGAPEIAWITAHTAAATTATILRGQEGTSPLAHSVDIPWTHAPTALDFDGIILSNAISADVALTTANTFYDGPSLSLYPGTWEVSAFFQYTGPVSWFIAKIWDGTTVFGGGGGYNSTTNGGVGLVIPSAIVVLVATTTVKGSAACDAGGGTLKALPNVLSTGMTSKVTRMTAKRVL